MDMLHWKDDYEVENCWKRLLVRDSAIQDYLHISIEYWWKIIFDGDDCMN